MWCFVSCRWLSGRNCWDWIRCARVVWLSCMRESSPERCDTGCVFRLRVLTGKSVPTLTFYQLGSKPWMERNLKADTITLLKSDQSQSTVVINAISFHIRDVAVSDEEQASACFHSLLDYLEEQWRHSFQENDVLLRPDFAGMRDYLLVRWLILRAFVSTVTWSSF